jgi:hypothetical protein
MGTVPPPMVDSLHRPSPDPGQNRPASRRPPERWYGRPGVVNGRGWLELWTHPREGRHPGPSRAPSKRPVRLVLAA